MLAGRWVDRHFDAQPPAHQAHLSERYAGLRHSPGARVHAQQHDFSRGAGTVEPQVLAMRLPGVDHRIVDVGHRRGEAQAVAGRRQPASDGYNLTGMLP